MKITSSGGDASITNLLSYDPAGTQNLSQTVGAQNASLSVNGLQISSASNTVTGAISGVTLNLSKGSGASTTLTVANDNSGIIQSVQGLVQAYNSTNTVLNNFTRYNASTKTGGILLGDANIQSIQEKIRSTLTSALSGLGSNTLTDLSQVGITFQKDGTLSLDSSKLQSALSTNRSDFASLFAANGKSTDSLVNFIGSTSNSKAGSYAVTVTALATQGKSVGSDKSTQASLDGSAAPNLTIDNTNDKISVSVDGGAAVVVSLTHAGPYATAAALAAQTQTDINSALTAAGQSAQVKVVANNGKLSIVSNSFGAASSVSVSNDAGSPGNVGATDLLGATPTTSRVATITAGVNDQLSVGVSGTNATITIPAGTYTSTALATQIQSALNGSSAFTASGISVSVSQSADVLTITSSRYGSSSAVSISGGTAKNNLFGATTTATIGTDVAGTINGVAAAGSGQFLTGAIGNDAEGLKLQILGGSIGARGTVNFAQGYAYNLNNALSSFLSTNGTIANSTDSANRSIADLQKQEDNLNVQLTATQKRYMAQFSALDTLIGQMNQTSTYLQQQLASLPTISSN
jgi:flagellar hook-associated protein 2